MKFSKFFPVILTAAVWALSGFAAEAEADGPDLRPIVCIDKDKIVNKTPQKDANFSALIDRLGHELVQSSVYRVVDMKNLAGALKLNEKFAVAGDDGGKKTEIRTPGFFIRLTISRYGFTTEKSQDAIYGVVSHKEFATVELILTVVDMKTAQIVKSANISRSAAANTAAAPGSAKIGNFREQALQEACQYVCQDIVKELLKLTPFYVMDVNGNEIMIDAPASVAPAGALFDIFSVGKAIRNRRTGKVTRRETKICTIRITKPGEDGSSGQVVLLYAQEPVKVDYIARPAVTAAPQAPANSAANPF